MNVSSWPLFADGARLSWAAAIVVAYFAASAWFMRSLWRRRPAVIASGTSAATLIAYASQTGFAEQVATQTAKSLRTAGTEIRVASLAELRAEDLPGVQQALFVVSTTGEGDAPDPAAAFVRRTLDRDIALPGLRYGVLALGDREYDNFCAFGHRLDTWLRHQGAAAMFDVVEVDNGDEGALRHWQHQLGVLSGSPDLADWETPRYERWRLVERRLLNPGSAGDPCFHIELRPCDAVNSQWQAGDIAEIDPGNSTWNATGAASMSKPLPHREYSIASVPAEGAIHLLVRQMRRPAGETGLGSGWLTQQAAVGHEIALRVRSNSSFHAPPDARPLILIGNGTGIAGLRSILKSRADGGHTRNWLVFGERNAQHDHFYRDEMDTWHRQQLIEKLDLVFSRDQAERKYVQHRLLECADEVRRWTADGASVYVCGSLQGMAPGVDSALIGILGAQAVEELAAAGRYRRDVY